MPKEDVLRIDIWPEYRYSFAYLIIYYNPSLLPVCLILNKLKHIYGGAI